MPHRLLGALGGEPSWREFAIWFAFTGMIASAFAMGVLVGSLP